MTYFLLLFLFSTFFSACLFYLLPISLSFFFFYLLHSRTSMAPPIATMSFISLSLSLPFFSLSLSSNLSLFRPSLHDSITIAEAHKLFHYSQPISNSFLLSYFISPLLIFFLSPAKNPSLCLVVYVWFCGDCIWFEVSKVGF